MTGRDDAIAALTAPGQRYELRSLSTPAGPLEVFAAAPGDLRTLFRDTRSDRTAFVYEDERLSFDEMYRRAASLAHCLVHRFGVAKGDRVAIAMRNYPEWVQGLVATASIGAIAVAMNALWQADELAFAIDDCQPTVVLADQERLERLEFAADAITHRSYSLVAVRAEDTSLPSVTRLVEETGTVPMPDVPIDPADPATIFYTSGSTGYPKGVLSSHRAVVHTVLVRELMDAVGRVIAGADPAAAAEAAGSPRGEVSLLTVPLFHVTASHAVLLTSYRTQTTIVSMRKWDTADALGIIAREGVTRCIAPPAVTNDLARAASASGLDLGTLRVVGGGGAARPPEHVRRLAAALPRVAPSTGWGMTETNSLGSTISGDDYLAHPGSSGRCHPTMRLRVVGEDGAEVACGMPGELQVRGTAMFAGYWNRPDADAASFVDGWFRTGDIATIDPEGYLHIVDRLKDLVIRGGENIGCGQVEAALVAYPGVHEAVVYAVPDERLGEEVGTTLFADGAIDLDELRSFLRQHLAAFEVPRFITVTNEPLPRTASGKLYKRQLRDEAVAALGQASSP